MKKNLFILFAIAVLFITNILEAQNASVTWNLISDQNVSSTAGALTGLTQTLSGMEMYGYQTVSGSGSGNSQLSRIAGGSWPAESVQNNDRYIQFAVAPKAGNIFNVSSISMYYGGKGGGNVKANIAYSTDPNFLSPVQLNAAGTPLAISSTAGTMQLLSYNPIVQINDGQTLYVRIYPWYTSASSGKYVCLQNVVITGTAVSTPVPASISWYLTSDNNVSATSGAVSGDTQTLSGMEVYGYQVVTGSSTGNSQLSRIAGGSWPAETIQNANRYVQFAVTPKPGATFNVDSISMFYGGKGGGNVKSNIAYSLDPNFLTSVQLNPENTPLAISSSGGTMQQISYSSTIQVDDGKTLYLRIYPWYTSASTGKYLCLQNLIISGTTSGQALVDLPTVTTATITNVSTTTAACGGTVVTDGGAVVTARGVCWNNSGNPTINDSKTSDGTGTGLFTSSLVNLTPGTKYYIRAYATNSGGTSYGKLDSLTTLAALTVPTVVTSDVSGILVNTATGGGNVTLWGGSDVTGRGICWNNTGNPTVSDSKTSEGIGIGSFTSVITGLVKGTKYYVRAYAVNNQGVGYGDVKEFTTQVPAPNIYKVVAQNGTGDYNTVQAAFDAVPDFYTGTYTIFVKKGVYKEKLLLTKNKVNVVLQGEDRDNTILTYDDYASKPGVNGTQASYSVAIDASDFTAMNITFQNTVIQDGDGKQAVALRTNGDRMFFFNCSMLGYQDTYYTQGAGRIYNQYCYIEGTVDFIFGRAITVFDHCAMKVLREGGTLTAASTEATYKYGYVFMNSKVITDQIGFDNRYITNFYLGRPWQSSPRTVFLNCEFPETLNPAGWLAWNVTPALYAEYNCTGRGSSTQQRVSWSKQLTAQEAGLYTIANIFSKDSGIGYWDWVPSFPTDVKEEESTAQIPAYYKLYQNYPNPFNPATTIKFDVVQRNNVELRVYDILGRQVKTILNEEKVPGHYEVKFDANNLTSGIYFYTLHVGDFLQTRKMLLLK